MSQDTISTAAMPASDSEVSGSKARTGHHLRRFRFDRPQKIAALLLLLSASLSIAWYGRVL